MTHRRLIAVDIGNSATKVGCFDLPAKQATGSLPQPVATKKYKTGEKPAGDLGQALPDGPCEWRIASVHREGLQMLRDWIKTNRPNDAVRVLTHHDLPIEVRIDFPDRLGLDRLAAAVAANKIRTPQRAAIVICAGSAITVNLVGAGGAFEGGVILPGFRMSAEALYSADMLPLAILAPNDQPPLLVGKNTEDAIRSGLFWGAVGAVREVVTRMSEPLSNEPDIFVTGGDLRQFTQYLGDDATFVPDMVLSGIAVAALCG
jgi:type III pantothenate kinase